MRNGLEVAYNVLYIPELPYLFTWLLCLFFVVLALINRGQYRYPKIVEGLYMGSSFTLGGVTALLLVHGVIGGILAFY